MCGRFTLHTEKQLLATRFEVELDGIDDLRPRYNVAPSQSILTVRIRDQQRVAEQMRWGLVPHWTKPLDMLPKMINARAETLASKPAFRAPFRRHRCLILADGFYEWQRPRNPGSAKTPYWISLKSEEPFGMAGLWATWRDPDEPELAPLQSCTIITMPANPLVAPIHQRMPAILTQENEARWLDPALDDRPEELLALLEPIDAGALKAHAVSRRVNTPASDHPELIAPAELEEPGVA